MGHDIYAYAKSWRGLKQVASMRRSVNDEHRAAIYELLDAQRFYADESGRGGGVFIGVARLHDAFAKSAAREELARETMFLHRCLQECSKRGLGGLQIEFV